MKEKYYYNIISLHVWFRQNLLFFKWYMKASGKRIKICLNAKFLLYCFWNPQFISSMVLYSCMWKHSWVILWTQTYKIELLHHTLCQSFYYKDDLFLFQSVFRRSWIISFVKCAMQFTCPDCSYVIFLVLCSSRQKKQMTMKDPSFINFTRDLLWCSVREDRQILMKSSDVPWFITRSPARYFRQAFR